MADNTIAVASMKEIVLSLEGAERLVPARIAATSRANARKFPAAYGFLAKKFLDYMEKSYGNEIEKALFSHMFMKFLAPFCTASFAEDGNTNHTKAWKAIEGMLASKTRGQEYAIGMGEFIAM
jgi:hypothetical protein